MSRLTDFIQKKPFATAFSIIGLAITIIYFVNTEQRITNIERNVKQGVCVKLTIRECAVLLYNALPKKIKKSERKKIQKQLERALRNSRPIDPSLVPNEPNLPPSTPVVPPDRSPPNSDRNEGNRNPPIVINPPRINPNNNPPVRNPSPTVRIDPPTIGPLDIPVIEIPCVTVPSITKC